MSKISEKEWRKIRVKVHGKPATKKIPVKTSERLLRLSIEIRDWDMDWVGDSPDGLFIRARHQGEKAQNLPWDQVPGVLTERDFRRLVRHVEDLVRHVENPRHRRRLTDGVSAWRTSREHTLHLG
jgi:hypothetical protein